MVRAIVTLALAAALVAAVTAGTAAAHKVTFESKLQLKVAALSDTVNQYSGKVTSDRSKCVRFRRVNVTAFGAQIATATTLISGSWLVQASPRPARGTELIAFTPRKFLKRSKKHKHKCASDFTERKAP